MMMMIMMMMMRILLLRLCPSRHLVACSTLSAAQALHVVSQQTTAESGEMCQDEAQCRYRLHTATEVSCLQINVDKVARTQASQPQGHGQQAEMLVSSLLRKC